MTELRTETLRSRMTRLEKRLRSSNLSPGKEIELEIELLKLRELRSLRLELVDDRGGLDV